MDEVKSANNLDITKKYDKVTLKNLSDNDKGKKFYLEDENPITLKEIVRDSDPSIPSVISITYIFEKNDKTLLRLNDDNQNNDENNKIYNIYKKKSWFRFGGKKGGKSKKSTKNSKINNKRKTNKRNKK